jgi:hypothetical protein
MVVPSVMVAGGGRSYRLRRAIGCAEPAATDNPVGTRQSVSIGPASSTLPCANYLDMRKDKLIPPANVVLDKNDHPQRLSRTSNWTIDNETG